MSHSRRICQHIAGYTQNRTGDYIDQTEGNNRSKSSACPLFCPRTTDGCSKKNMQVVNDCPSDFCHRSTNGIYNRNISSDNNNQVTNTDHKTCRRHNGNDGHQHFSKFLQKVEINRELFLISIFLRSFFRFLCHFFIFFYHVTATALLVTFSRQGNFFFFSLRRRLRLF